MKILMIIIALFFSIAVQSQTVLQDKKDIETKKPVLEVKLSTLKSTFCVGEEIAWRYDLTNLTEKTIKFYEPYLHNNWVFGRYRTQDQKIKEDKVEAFINHAWPSVDPEIHKLIVLEPNVTQIVTITGSSKSELVEKAGKYSYKVWVQGVESNEIVFEVKDCGKVKTEKQK